MVLNPSLTRPIGSLTILISSGEFTISGYKIFLVPRFILLLWLIDKKTERISLLQQEKELTSDFGINSHCSFNNCLLIIKIAISFIQFGTDKKLKLSQKYSIERLFGGVIIP